MFNSGCYKFQSVYQVYTKTHKTTLLVRVALDSEMSKYSNPNFIPPNYMIVPHGLVTVYCKHGNTFVAKCFDTHKDDESLVFDYIDHFGDQAGVARVKLLSNNSTLKDELEARNIEVEVGRLYVSEKQHMVVEDLAVIPLYGPEGLLAKLAGHNPCVDIYVFTPPCASIVASISATQTDLVVCDQSMRQLFTEHDKQESLDMRKKKTNQAKRAQQEAKQFKQLCVGSWNYNVFKYDRGIADPGLFFL